MVNLEHLGLVEYGADRLVERTRRRQIRAERFAMITCGFCEGPVSRRRPMTDAQASGGTAR